MAKNVGLKEELERGDVGAQALAGARDGRLPRDFRTT
jgi:hypothetical protein